MSAHCVTTTSRSRRRRRKIGNNFMSRVFAYCCCRLSNSYFAIMLLHSLSPSHTYTHTHTCTLSLSHTHTPAHPHTHYVPHSCTPLHKFQVGILLPTFIQTSLSLSLSLSLSPTNTTIQNCFSSKGTHSYILQSTIQTHPFSLLYKNTPTSLLLL